MKYPLLLPAFKSTFPHIPLDFKRFATFTLLSYRIVMSFYQRTFHCPAELQGVFDKAAGVLSDAEMAEMNYQVETEGVAPEETASEFLRAKGLSHE